MAVPLTTRLGRPALMLTLACAVTLGSPAWGAKLGKGNSVRDEFRSVAPITVKGPSCGSGGSGSTTLAPARKGVSKAYGITVAKPKVGDLDENGFARVSAVRVSDQTIIVDAVVNQPSQCTFTGEWTTTFDPDITYARRVQVKLRPDADRKPAKLRPRSMRIFGMDTLKRIRWKRFGGKTGSGTGHYRSGVRGCRSACPGNNKRVKVRLRRVRRCQDSGILEYTQMDLIYRGRKALDVRIHC
jgi:hypothetical protein